MALATVSSAEEITAPDVPLNVVGVFPHGIFSEAGSEGDYTFKGDTAVDLK